jgi:hypothetical protein
LLARVCADGDYDGLISGRDIGRDHHVQLHDAGDEPGRLPGECELRALAADGDGDGRSGAGVIGMSRTGNLAGNASRRRLTFAITYTTTKCPGWPD